MKRSRVLSLTGRVLNVVLLALMALFAVAAFLLIRQSAILPSQANDEVADAWERARAAGSYAFAADVVQRTIPLPSVTNVGRQSRQDTLRLEGETNLHDETMELMLWSQGGSILDAESGVELRIADEVAMARQGNGEWQEMGDFTDAFAPSGDFLAFLSAAKNITREGTESRAGITFTRYSYEIDGPGFALYMRDQMEQHLLEKGKLPPSVQLDAPQTYAQMTGSGELWVDANGLPLRQVLHLAFPPGEDNELQAEVTVDFSGFGDGAPLAASGANGTLAALLAWRPSPLLWTHLGLTMFLAAGALLAVRHRESRRMYTAMVTVVITSMVISPLAQTQQAVAFAASYDARAVTQEQQADDADRQRAIVEEAATSDFDPHASPLAVAGASLPNRGALLATQTQTNGAACRLNETELLSTSTQNSDADSLTDYQECLLGTDPTVPDSDGDQITDTLEIQGFSYGGEMWYSDPLDPDSNRDGIADTQEWLLTDTPPDSDDDGTPDLFDEDNDGDGIIDRLDLSPFQTTAVISSTTGTVASSTRLFGETAPLPVIVDGLQPDQPAFVEFQVRPIHPERLWYAFNVLDWPEGDDAGQMRDVDGHTFADEAVAEGNDFAAREENGDLKLVPMLEITISGDDDNLPATGTETLTDSNGITRTGTTYPELNRYGIFVQTLREVNASEGITETVKAAYVPLNLVTDERTGEQVGFQGKMLYRPGEEWGSAQEVRLVWVVQGLVDVCLREEGGVCQEYEYNRHQVLQTYYDEWFLTGLNVREDHGTEIAIIYEDPAADSDVEDDRHLVALARGLDETFLVGSDCGTQSGVTGCVVDGQRDITTAEIERRFDRASNSGVTDEQRWDIPNVLRVERSEYEHRDEAVVTTATTETTRILEDAFDTTEPVTPTLMFAREERARNVNLEEQGYSPAISWSGAELTVDFGAGGGREVQTIAGLSWAPYYQDSVGAWKPMPMENYWAELDRRYLDDDSTDIELGKLVVMQLYYLGLYQGILNVVQNGNAVTTPELSKSDEQIAEIVQFVIEKTVLEGVNTFLIGNLFPDAEPVWRTLAALKRADHGIGAHRLPANQFYSQIVFKARLARGLSRTSSMMGMVALGLAIADFSLLVAQTRSDDDSIDLGRNVMALVGTSLALVATVMSVVQAIAAKAVEVGTRAAVRVVLTGTTTTTSSRVAGAIGLVVAIGITWGLFIHQVVSGGLQAGSPAYNMLVATAIAATVITVLFFIISLTTIGMVIIAVLAFVDALLAVLGVQFSIMGWLTEQLANAFYGYGETATVEFKDVDIGEFETSYANPELGMRADNRLVVQAVVTTTLAHLDPSEEILDNSEYADIRNYWAEDSLQGSKINHAISGTPADSETTWTTSVDHVWKDEDCGAVVCDFEHDMYQGVSRQDSVTGPSVAFVRGINVRPDAMLVTSYDIPAVECERIMGFSDCDGKRITGTAVSSLGFVFDIYPVTLEEFYGMAWGGWAAAYGDYDGDGSTGTSNGSMEFGTPRDHDGDGLIALEWGGNDPNDDPANRGWDSDSDGLADARELELRADGYAIFLTDNDSDSDGLTDGEEVRLGSRPDQFDSDGDGLDDGEEAEGWTFTYRYNGTTPVVTVVKSDLMTFDSDGDGMSDQSERDLHLSDPAGYPYHPRVANPQPVALSTSYSGTGIVADFGETYLRPGSSLAYSTTVRNDLDASIYAQGMLSVSVPSLLGGTVQTHTIDYFGGEERTYRRDLTVPSNSASGSADITNDVFAQLQPDRPESDWVIRRTGEDLTGVAAYRTTIYHTAIAPVTTTFSDFPPYVVAAVEGGQLPNQSITDNSAKVVFYRTDANGIISPSLTLADIGDNLATNADYAGPVDVACNQQGKCLAVWETQHEDGSRNQSTQIFGSIFWADSTQTDLTDLAFQISGASSGDTQKWVQPSVATDGTNFLVAYARAQSQNNESDLLARYVPADAEDLADLGAVQVLSTKTETVSQSSYPDVAWTGTTGGYIVTWQRLLVVGGQNPVNRGEIRAAYLTAAGAIATNNTTMLLSLSVCPNGMGAFNNSQYEQNRPQVAANPATGEAVVAAHFRARCGTTTQVEGWRAYRLVNRTLQSAPLSQEVATNGWLGTDRNRRFLPRVAFNSDPDGVGSWTVAWSAGDASGNIEYKAFSSDGTTGSEKKSYVRASSAPAMSLTCNGDECAFIAAAPTNPPRLFMNRFDLLVLPPGQGELDQTRVDQFKVDNDRPDTRFDRSLYYVQSQTSASVLQVGGVVSDTSGAQSVEVQVGNGGWQAAQGLETWVFNATLPANEGTTALQVRSTDLVGNVDDTPGTATVVRDGTAPAVTIGTSYSVVFDEAELRWEIHLSGTTSDPAVGGQPGSGEQSVGVRVTPNGSGWQSATVRAVTDTWTIEYPLAVLDEDGGLDPNATGQYTVSVRATDVVGNRTAEANYPTMQVSVDLSAPQATLSIGGAAPSTVTRITTPATLNGTLAEPDAVKSGVASLQLRFTDQQLPEAGQSWQSVTLSASGANVANTTWSSAVPQGMEGFYQIDLRGTDVAGNVAERSTWGKWLGEIDTRAPDVDVEEVSSGGFFSPTVYEITARDLNLREAAFQVSGCSVQPWNTQRGYYSTPYYTANNGNPARLYELTVTCSVYSSTPPTVNICDAFNHCTTADNADLRAVNGGGNRAMMQQADEASLRANVSLQSAALGVGIQQPANGSVVQPNGSINLSGTAHADGGLQSLAITANGTQVHTQTFNNAPVDANWSGTWTGATEGTYALVATVTQVGGATSTSTPISVTVDTVAPTIDISDTLINGDNQVATARADLVGTAEDSVGVYKVEVRVGSNDWEEAVLSGTGPGPVTWTYPWILDPETQANFSVSARVTDLAGRTTTATETVTVDLVPPAPVNVTLSYLDSSNVSHALAPEQTVRDAATLVINWTASSDASGLGSYLVGWTTDPTPDEGLLTSYDAASQHQQAAGEAQTLYAHVVSRDANGNRQWQTLGPVYVDAPNTPTIVRDLDYRGWMESACAPIGADREVARTALTGAALNDVQRLYAGWDNEFLRLTWTGANWDGDGDLFVYLDTTTGGATIAYDPYTTASPAISFPSTLAADYVVWIEGSGTAQLLRWNGTGWDVVSGWPGSGGFYQLDTSLDPAHTDILLPFTLLGSPTSLRALALASEEEALRIWAAMPDKNPLNSERVINPLAAGYVGQGFTLTQDYHFSSLATGQCPASGQFTDADVRVTLAAEPQGVTAGFLRDDLLDLLSPTARLDANLDGVLDLALPVDVEPYPLGAGQTVRYLLSYTNEGTADATNVQVNLTAFGGIALTGGTTVNLGTIPAGATGTREVLAQVTTDSTVAAELKAVVSDATHGDFDWLWAHHRIDRAAPTGLAIQPPVAYVRSGGNPINGVVADESGTYSVTLRAQPGTGNPTLTTCADADPHDGLWTCVLNVASTAATGTQFQLSVRAADLYGNTSGWTTPAIVTVDNVSPTISLDAASQQAISDNFLTNGEYLLSGQVADNFRAASAELCVTRAGLDGEQCSILPLQLSDTGTTGTWHHALPIETADGLAQTMTLYARDAAGNRSVAVTRNFQVDSGGPALNVTGSETTILLSDYLAGSTSATPVLQGTATDATGVRDMAVRMDTPSGEQLWFTVARSGNNWSFTPQFDDSPSVEGRYLLRVYAYDGENNVSGRGPFELNVTSDAIIADAGGPYTAQEGQAITLDASASQVVGTVTYAWDTDNDGQYDDATGVNPSVVFADNGVFLVGVRVSGGDALSDTDTAQVTVSNVAPTVEAGTNRTTSEGNLIHLAPATFNDKGTRDTHTATINWGDGTPTEAGTVTETPFGPPGSTEGANGSVAGSHVYADNGTYTVNVCVTDDDAATACDTLTITANNAAPRVYGGADRAASEGQTVSFPNVGFTDKGTRDTHTATINWGDGTATEAGTVTETPFGPPGSVSGATGRVAGSHVYADNGTYTVEFCVTDDDGAKTCDTVLMTIHNVAPRVFGGGDFAANEGQLIRFTNVVLTDKGTLDTHSATINWGDGTATEAGTVTETPFGPPGSTSGMTGKIAGSHVYADNGSYSVEFCATDDDGGAACDTVVITVRNVAPTVNAGPDQTLNEGDTSTLALARFNDRGTLDTHTATINWGDGTQVNATVTESPFGPPGSTAGANGTVSGSHIYGDNGTYSVNVCVTDDDGAKTCDTIVVTVNNVNPVLTLDKTGAVSTAGGLAFLGRRYVPQTHSATASDAGSDDLRFDWTFLPHTATDRTTYYNNGTSPDPLPSPGGTFPFSATDTATVTFPRAGVFTVAVSVRDDDGGTDSESLTKLVTDSGSCTTSHGQWRQQYSGKGNSLYPQATLLAYLDITTFASGVFSEMAPAGTIAQAQAILQPSGAEVGDPHPSNMKGKATQELLAAWLNFAKGGIGWNTRLASGKSFSQTIYQIEAIILNPASTHNDYVQAKNLAQSINNHGCS